MDFFNSLLKGGDVLGEYLHLFVTEDAGEYRHSDNAPKVLRIHEIGVNPLRGEPFPCSDKRRTAQAAYRVITLAYLMTAVTAQFFLEYDPALYRVSGLGGTRLDFRGLKAHEILRDRSGFIL